MWGNYTLWEVIGGFCVSCVQVLQPLEIVDDFGHPMCEYCVFWNITICVIFNHMQVLLRKLQLQS